MYQTNNQSDRDKPKEQVTDKCIEFSRCYFDSLIGLDNRNQKINNICDKLRELNDTILKSGDLAPNIEYLERLILINGNSEFMIPYYYLCKIFSHPVNERISIHKGCHFGLLGTVDEILNKYSEFK